MAEQITDTRSNQQVQSLGGALGRILKARGLTIEEIRSKAQPEPEVDEAEYRKIVTYHAIMNGSGIVGMDRERTLDTYKPVTTSEQKAKAAVTEALETFLQEKRSLYLFGQHGPGKTHLMLAYLHGLALKRWWVKYFAGGSLTSGLDDFHFGRTERQNPRVVAMEAEVLGIDDIEKNEIIEGHRRYADLFRIIDHRSAQSLPTIITSNMPLAVLCKPGGLGNAIHDRLKHCIEIEVTGPSGRGK